MKLFYKFSVAFIIYALLAIPDNKSSIHLPEEVPAVSTKWWGKFAQNLVKYRITSKENQAYQYNKHRNQLTKHLDQLLLELTEPDNPILDSISLNINKLSALASLVPGTIHEFEKDVAAWRKLLKYQSRYWGTSSDFANNRLFRFMVESRLAFESALIQSQEEKTSLSAPDNSISFHSKTVNNIKFQSGDIIAYSLKVDDDPYVSFVKELPNMYKHLGSVFINDSVASVIYLDHINGLSILPIEKFVNERAPNGIIMRLRSDLPDILRKPALPSLAASNMYKMALSGSYKYDYHFDSESHEYIYDWELISLAFDSQGLSIDANSFRRSSSSIHVGKRKSHLTPSEIEFDHRFIIAGEWYSSDLLYKNRLLTAATAAIIEHQDKSDFLNPLLLPGYRLLKAYSMFIGQFGLQEPIPSGITAQTQLVFNTLEAKQKKLIVQLKKELLVYEKERNHKATYLKMLQKANEIMNEQKPGSL